ncbi:MAG: NapC/NirT family cytochrome c [Coriobacteriales bacterium]|nr:NapC/NirT family cytochrome c [Coriobacteriales bacterium]
MPESDRPDRLNWLAHLRERVGSLSLPAKLAVFTTAGLVALASVAGASLGVARATDSPVFCRSACHEMQPYHNAWAQGPHADVACVECHVDTGTVARLEHKVVALKELQIHVTGDPKFPKATSAEVPNERCVRCHDKTVVIKEGGFSHVEHAKRRPCQTCHANVGHEVGNETLKAAGLWSGRTRTMKTARVSPAGGIRPTFGPKGICADCHSPGDWAQVHIERKDCATCHQAPAQHRAGVCSSCHEAGVSFAFVHPKEGACADCHEQPAEHRKVAVPQKCESCHREFGKSWAFKHPTGGSCATCHQRPAKHRKTTTNTCEKCHANAGKDWAFKHPTATSKSCTTCHERPSNHTSGPRAATDNCTRCHSTGRSWSFAHPAPSSECTSCHNKPSNHNSGVRSQSGCTSCHASGSSWAFRHPSGGSCTTCHKKPSKHTSSTKSCRTCHSVGKTWAFSHPGSGASCTGCHSRRSGHRSGQCSSCHRTSSWSFRHPSSTRCASCHNSPKNHYGTSCASCHSKSRGWKNASFKHPRVPGGEHTNRSFACSNCHPKGYSSYNCSKCHGSATGPRGD